jgi:hypothetical protein
MQRVLDEGEVLGLPWPCLVAFVRLTTLPNSLRKPLRPEQALALTFVRIVFWDGFES